MIVAIGFSLGVFWLLYAWLGMALVKALVLALVVITIIMAIKDMFDGFGY